MVDSSDALTFLVLAAVLTVASLYLPRLWRHQSAFWDRPRSWWPYDRESWPRFVRLAPLAIAFGWLLLVAGIVGALLPAREDQLDLVWPIWFSVGATALPLVFLALAISIFRAGRPRFIVPPHLRG
jgi:uncharacterized membrane protein YhdT